MFFKVYFQSFLSTLTRINTSFVLICSTLKNIFYISGPTYASDMVPDFQPSNIFNRATGLGQSK